MIAYNGPMNIENNPAAPIINGTIKNQNFKTAPIKEFSSFHACGITKKNKKNKIMGNRKSGNI